MGLKEKLIEREAEWRVLANYDKSALPEVLEYNRQFRQTQTGGPYNDSILRYIIEQEGLELSIELTKYLGTEVYLSQRDFRREEAEALHREMTEKGYVPLSAAVVRDAHAQGKKIALLAKSCNDWCEVKVDKVFKPFVSRDGDTVGLMTPRARTRGHHLSNFSDAYCKLI